MKAIKSYSAFASGIYKILVFFGLPVAVGLVQWGLSRFIAAPLHMVFCVLTALVLIIMDQWVLGGCCVKRVESLDFLRTSLRGKKMFQKALIMDCIVRGAVCAEIMTELYVIDYLLNGNRLFVGNWIPTFISFALFAYVVASIGVFANRYVDMLFLGFTIAYAIVQISLIVQIYWGLSILPIWLWLVLLLLLAVVFTWLVVSRPMKKLERGYGDETVEE